MITVGTRSWLARSAGAAESPFCAGRCAGASQLRVSRRCVPERRRCVRVFAKKDENAVGKVLNGVVDAVTPGFIPRPVAKLVVGFFGISFVFSLFQKLVSFAVFLAFTFGGAFLLFKSQGGGGGSSPPASKADDNDFLGSARKIMDKYK